MDTKQRQTASTCLPQNMLLFPALSSPAYSLCAFRRIQGSLSLCLCLRHIDPMNLQLSELERCPSVLCLFVTEMSTAH
jgi:hypothetical protein